MLFFRLNQVSRECPFLFVYSIRLRNTLSSMMRAMSVVDEAQTPDLLHGYSKSADMMAIAKYPHFKLGKGLPCEGIENLRPESKEVIETFMSWQPKNRVPILRHIPVVEVENTFVGGTI